MGRSTRTRRKIHRDNRPSRVCPNPLERGTSDTRCAPNVYSARRSLLLHFQLLVAQTTINYDEASAASPPLNLLSLPYELASTLSGACLSARSK